MPSSARPSVHAYIVEQGVPAAEVPPAGSVAMRDRPVAAYRYLRCLSGYIECIQHTLVRERHRPGEALLLSVRLELVYVLEWVSTHHVDCHPVVIVRTDLLLQAPQLGAAGRSKRSVEVQEHRLALVGEA